jgi:hypothetical protein
MKEIWQAAVKECGDKAFELFCLKGWGIERLANTQKKNGTFAFDSLNEFAAALIEYEIKEAQKSPDSFPYSGGKFSPEYYQHDYYFHLKPLDELVEMDIERYGEKNALLMYEFSGLGGDWQDIPVHANCADVLVALGNNFYEHRRKLYANAPFNIEWAKAGVAVEHENREGEFKKYCGGSFIDSFKNDGYICFKNDGAIHENQLRHPFPPLKELGL